MQTYDIQDSKGRVFAFEIDNTGFGRSVLVKVVKKIPEVKILRVPKSCSWFREDVFCEFEVAGCIFEAWEPFGDNSRFWIGPKDVKFDPQKKPEREWRAAIEIVHNVFADA
jgi:hypothetical protein